MEDIPIYFSDVFNVSEDDLEKYGALNISLVTDLPLFIDPFLLFNSSKPEYLILHEKIIKYVHFLRKKSISAKLDIGIIKALYTFPEEKGNWLGYSELGNSGRGLGRKFAESADSLFRDLIINFDSDITESPHIEKISLLSDGVGRDNISDFTTNLIKEFIIEYTQEFAERYIEKKYMADFAVKRVCFNYETEVWEDKIVSLPAYADSYILLTPKDILRQDDIWISKYDLRKKFVGVLNSIDNDVLRSQLSNYFSKAIIAETARERNRKENEAIRYILRNNPEVADYYIKLKEQDKDSAKDDSTEKVDSVAHLLIRNVKRLTGITIASDEFRENIGETYDEARNRVIFLKDVIENKDGWRYFYHKGKPINTESNLQLMYRLTWFGTILDVNREVNNGRGPVDYSVSFGALDKTLVEFKLASNSHLKRNLKNQLDIYKRAADTEKGIKAIMYFDEKQRDRVIGILEELDEVNSEFVILIDASPKESASVAE